MGFEVDIKRVERSFSALLENSKKDAPEALKPHAKGIVRTAAEITPPGGHGVKGVAAKKRGEATMTGDILAVFEPVRVARFVDTPSSSIRSIHDKARTGKGGRVRPVTPRHKVLGKDLRAYIKERKKDVGFLAGGFQFAARRLGFSLPAWQSRHGSPGGYVLKVTSSRITIRIINEVEYAGHVAKLDGLLKWALNAQAKKIDRMLEDYQQKQFQKAGFNSRR